MTVNSKLLHKFWIRFSQLPAYSHWSLGIGVTAYSQDDAVSIVKAAVFKDEETPSIESIVEITDLSQLDQGHVIPNMEPPVWRGVWFPKGFQLAQ